MKTAPADWLAHLAAPGIADGRIAALVLLLVVASALDVRTRRIPNWLTLSGAMVGIALSPLGAGDPRHAALMAVAGMGAGLALLLPLYLLRVIGAGDVKLMAMVGAFVGVSQIVPAVLCVFVAGGVLALAWSAYRRVFRRVTAGAAELAMSMAFAALSGIRPSLASASAGTLPYGLSIAVGTLAWLLVAQFATR